MSVATIYRLVGSSIGLGEPEPPDPPEPGGELDVSLMGNPTFNPSDPRLKDGSEFTSTMSTIYAGLINYWIGGSGKNSTSSRLGSGNLYQLGRDAGTELSCLEMFFRLTGDLRILDAWAQLGNVARGALRTTWYPGHSITRQPHGKPFWPWINGSPSNFSDWGGDDHMTDSPKSWAVFFKLAWALELNRGNTSPGGLDYGALADIWKAHAANYEWIWSGSASGAPSGSAVTSTYRGKFVPSIMGGSGFTRAGANQYPINMRTMAHDNLSCDEASYYLCRLLGKSSGVLETAMNYYIPEFINYQQGSLDTPYGEGFHCTRSAHRWSASQDYENPSTYGEKVVVTAMSLFLEGASPLITDDLFIRHARSTAAFMLVGSASNPTIKAGIVGTARRSYTSPLGGTRTVDSACESGSSGCNDRTKANYASYGFNLLQAYDTPDDRLEDAGATCWLGASSASGGSLSTPKELCYPLGLFMKEADIRSKDLHNAYDA